MGGGPEDSGAPVGDAPAAVQVQKPKAVSGAPPTTRAGRPDTARRPNNALPLVSRPRNPN
jgi:hypothetical protein